MHNKIARAPEYGECVRKDIKKKRIVHTAIVSFNRSDYTSLRSDNMNRGNAWDSRSFLSCSEQFH